MSGGQRNVNVARFTDGLAVVERLYDRQLAGALLDQAGDAEEIFGPLGPGGLGPHGVVSPSRGRYRPIDVGAAGLSDHGQGLFGRRIETGELFVLRGITESSVDEEAVAGAKSGDGR